MLNLYRSVNGEKEYCFNVEVTVPLTNQEMEKLQFLLADGFDSSGIKNTSFLGNNAIEVGPRMNFETAWSSNMVSICHSVGLGKIVRIEKSRRNVETNEGTKDSFVGLHHDRMTECIYPEPLSTFSLGVVPEAVYDVLLKENGPSVLKKIPGTSMDDWDCQLYYNYFVNKHGRNPTIVEIMDLNNANSEHSRHGYFKGKQIIDGIEMPKTLFEIVIATWRANWKNSIIAFKDNSSGIFGRYIWTVIPKNPGKASSFEKQKCYYHITFTAETHNFPTGVAPFPGAETGTGGRIRDGEATGKGSLVVAGTAGYCVANLRIPGYILAWEKELIRPENLASALEIEIGASNGASDYGNKFGEPLIQGFTRSFDLRLSNGCRWGWLKPIMFTGGVGQIDDRHIEKDKAKPGMLIVQVGGPAYRVGFGGGAASSLIQGDQDAKLDFNAVQRGNAEMEQKMNRVIRTCVEMGDDTPIASIHDQGAGGPANVLKELVEESGGRIDIRKINVGDPTMSVLEIWVAEYQERNGFLIYPEKLEEFKEICKREKVNCEVLGEATDDGIFVAYDSSNNTKPVELNLKELMGDMPQKTFEDWSVDPELKPLVLPDNLSVIDALTNVFSLVSVGSKRFLSNKVDRSVTGLVAQQQCCGPLQLTVGDVAVISQSHFENHNGEYSGAAISIGEQPIKMLIDPAKGARMAVGEALTNMIGAKIDGLGSIKCSTNWMWAPKLHGEGAALYKAALAMRDSMIEIGIASDGGKDSLSMATRVGEETIKSPRQLVISAYTTMADITKVVTPDIKRPGESILFFIDLAKGKNRLGGSALAQVYGQIGNDSPDMDDTALVKRTFYAVQELIERNLLLACHDRSDGGLITTISEMAFAGNCGFEVNVLSADEKLPALFSEELGLVFECMSKDWINVIEFLDHYEVPFLFLGNTTQKKLIKVSVNEESVLVANMPTLRLLWEETSHQLDRIQASPECVDQEKDNIFERIGPKYNVSFSPEETAKEILLQKDKPKVCILREEGSNSDREMTSAFFQAGFEPWDVTMTDLLEGKISLEQFRGLVAVGGFSYADVPESAKGWASAILFNEKLRTMFDKFYERKDTFSLGVCNGCQLFALLGWVPWKGIPNESLPRFVHNNSGRFESRWSTVRILPSPAMMLKGMENSILGIHVNHGEGKLEFLDKEVWNKVQEQNLSALVYTDDEGNATEEYPFNPNGSVGGITGLSTPDGRHLAMMPHPERTFLKWQWHYMPEQMKNELKVSPWLKMFQNAYKWCLEN